jgi:uncharacterized membrane protein YcaP (DUF421 family)
MVPDWVQIVLRSIGFFVLVLLLSRMLGRKVAARMTLFDVMYAIVLGMIATAVSLKIVANAVYGFIALLTWGLVGVGLTFLSMKSKAVRDFLHGREAVVIKHGKIMEEQLKKMRFTPEDLLQQLRAKQIFNVADVEFAVMESNGEINALLKTDRQPVTPHHLGLQAAPETGTQTVIIDGNIMDEPLFTMGLNRGWLKTELKKIGVAPENVFLAQVDSRGDLYVDLFDDAILPPEPTARQLLLATLEKAKADLNSFVLDSGGQETKTMYRQCVREMESLLYDLRPLLK